MAVLCVHRQSENRNSIRYITGGSGGGWLGGVQPPPRSSEDIGGVLNRMSKKNWHLNISFCSSVFLYGCNLLNKGSFNIYCLAVAYLVSEFKPTPTSRKFDKVAPDCKLSGKCLVFLFQHPN
jgi:hypothetical protein